MEKKFSFLLILLPVLFFTINSCSRVWNIGILNQKDNKVTLVLKLRIPVLQHHFQSWITGTEFHSGNLQLPFLDLRNWFRVKSGSITYWSNCWSNQSKFEEKIQLRNIRYNEDRGEVSLELSPKYAYFIDWSNNNNDPRSLIYSYSEIRVESSVGKIVYSGEEILNAFQYDEDCECFLMTLK